MSGIINLTLTLALILLPFVPAAPAWSVDASGAITSATIDRGVLVVATQRGKVYRNGLLWADWSTSVVQDGERGLTGIAVDGEYIYALHVDRAERMRLSRAPLADPAALAPMLDLSRAAVHHSTAFLSLGPDGMLYLGIGDNDEGVHALNANYYAGKVLRIGRDGMGLSDNPFFTGNAGDIASRVWATGFRQPWSARWQGDALIVADTGEGRREEVNAVERGRSYGWPCFEGELAYLYSPLLCSTIAAASPVYAYDHGTGRAIVGTAIIGDRLIVADYNGLIFRASDRSPVADVGIATGMVQFGDIVIVLALDGGRGRIVRIA